MVSILKSASLILFSLLFIALFSNCNSSKEEQIIDNSIRHEFIYSEGPCCQNLRSTEDIALPDFCESSYDLFYATNLEDFSISQNYSIGDVLSLSFVFDSVCEANGEGFDCVIECDIRHGIPIQIISVE